MITLLTGQPGHGKTAYAVVRMFDWKKQGRDVYVHGIKDFNYEAAGMHRLEDPKRWMDLPDGSAVVLDEVYNDFPARNAARAVPEHVNLLATHRHRGFDFIFITQQTVQIDPFMKGLFEEHIHVKKKFGKYTKLLRWSSFQNNVRAVCTDAQDWVRPNWVFKYFTSTTVNTSRLHVPKWIILVGILLLGIIAGLIYLKSTFSELGAREPSDATSAITGAGPFPQRGTSGGDGAATEPRWETAADYARDHLPRFATMPWTSAVFDDRAPVTDPQLFCMASGPGINASGDWNEGGCHCTTEQGTRYDIGDGECRRVARYGTPYNPYTQRGRNQPPPAPPQPQPVALGPAARDGGIRGYVGSVGRPTVDESFGTVTRPTP